MLVNHDDDNNNDDKFDHDSLTPHYSINALRTPTCASALTAISTVSADRKSGAKPGKAETREAKTSVKLLIADPRRSPFVVGVYPLARGLTRGRRTLGTLSAINKKCLNLLPFQVQEVLDRQPHRAFNHIEGAASSQRSPSRDLPADGARGERAS